MYENMFTERKLHYHNAYKTIHPIITPIPMIPKIYKIKKIFIGIPCTSSKIFFGGKMLAHISFKNISLILNTRVVTWNYTLHLFSNRRLRLYLSVLLWIFYSFSAFSFHITECTKALKISTKDSTGFCLHKPGSATNRDYPEPNYI